MGSSEDSPRKPHKQTHIKSKLKILILVVLTNILTIYIFTSPSFKFNLCNYTRNLPLWDLHTLHQEQNTTQKELSASTTQIVELKKKLATATSLLETLLSELAHFREDPSTNTGDWGGELSSELKLLVGPHKLPLGFSPNMGTDDIHPPMGAGCHKFLDDLNQYMSYDAGGECPVDNVFAQRLMLKGCEPLPRRRCHPKSPVGYVEPTPLPASLWATPPDTSIIWEPYNCKSYQCLIDRPKTKGYRDCKDCFDLQGREKTRWLRDNGLDYGIDDVLSTKPPGTVRIGLDIGGGTGTFAARMRERNVTIITSTMDFDGPFNSFIASRGLVPIHMSVAHRLPFFENTLDIVHSMHVLSNWIPDTILEFTLYDIYRVLRPGGLFWLDRFFCRGSQLNTTYVPMLNRVGFNKLRWNAGLKFDRRVQMNEWYLSALLEKPMS
ncbi:hypothetical protein AAC387_Pa01g0378 [Persea americana]